jgi:hypothetical protein
MSINVMATGDFPLINPSYSNSWQAPAVTGAIQWNGTNKCFEVSTGSGWQKITMDVSITTASDVAATLNWANKKMKEEQELEALAESNVTIKDLLRTMKDTEEKIKIVKALIKAEVKPEAVVK